MNSHSIIAGTAASSNQTDSSVRSVLNGDENNWARAQAHAEMLLRGACCSGDWDG